MGAKEGKKLPVSEMKKKLNSENTSPAMKKKLNFAINARKWKHEDGGFLNEGDKKKRIQKTYGEFVEEMNVNPNLRDRARLDYYNQRLDSSLFEKDFDKMRNLKKSIPDMNERTQYADSLIRAGSFDRELTPDQIKSILGDQQFGDYVTTKQKFINPEKVKGTKETDPMIYGLRNSFANPIPAHERAEVFNKKPLADFRMDMSYNPKEGYSSSSKILKEYEYGGHMMLPEYGFGSWLKENAGGLLKGAGSLVKLIPGIGTIAGPILDVAGSAVGGLQANKQAKLEAVEQQKLIDEKKAADAKQQLSMENAVRSQNLFAGDKDINYGETFAFGGELMEQSTMQPQITEYSKKADLHSEGIGGVPVDVRGNPTSVSKTSAVGLTEGGEVTWNGYVFSNKLKLKK